MRRSSRINLRAGSLSGIGMLIMVVLFLIVYICAGAGDIHGADKTLDARAERILKKMSMREKAGQVLFVTAPKDAAGMCRKYKYGGYLFFAYDFAGSSKAGFRRRVRGIQTAAKINMFTGVDEEGGTVTRVSRYRQFRKRKYGSPKEVYRTGGYRAISKDTKDKCLLLKSIGLNTNMAPVADVPYRKGNFIYKRSFSRIPARTSRYIRRTVGTMNRYGVVSAVKHFPGYGGNGDTHSKVIYDNRKLSTFEKRDLVPFREAIEQNCGMIMLSHNVVRCFDRRDPASVSKKVHDYIRDEMGYDGVLITDSMGMNGVTKSARSGGALAVKAFNAGNDMILTPYGRGSFNAIYKAVKTGKISRKRLDRSVKRILKLKLRMGIIR